MTKTTYYDFNKPEGTDLVNPLVDTNPNWDITDSALHELNERSISNATEIVTLGVHTISRLDDTAKFLRWIATANFTAGETFTVDGLPVVASTPAGASLSTGAYVTGSVVLAALNADNTAMTIYVSGTNVATDSERLGGELPSYYATQSDLTALETDVNNILNQIGNASIVGIGDGTIKGAISYLNSKQSNIVTVGTLGITTGSYTNSYLIKVFDKIVFFYFSVENNDSSIPVFPVGFRPSSDVTFRFVNRNAGGNVVNVNLHIHPNGSCDKEGTSTQVPYYCGQGFFVID